MFFLFLSLFKRVGGEGFGVINESMADLLNSSSHLGSLISLEQGLAMAAISGVTQWEYKPLKALSSGPHFDPFSYLHS